MAQRLRQSGQSIASDVHRTSTNIDALIAKLGELIESLDRLVEKIESKGIYVGAEVAGHPIPANVIVKPNDEGE